MVWNWMAGSAARLIACPEEETGEVGLTPVHGCSSYRNNTNVRIWARRGRYKERKEGLCEKKNVLK